MSTVGSFIVALAVIIAVLFGSAVIAGLWVKVFLDVVNL